jgi:hypothetical protein
MEHARPLGHHLMTKHVNHGYRWRKEIQAKGIESIFKKIIAKTSQVLRREGSSRRLSEHQLRKITKETSIDILKHKIYRTGDSKMVTRRRKQIPKVNSWRDAGDTPGRKNHQEEAKL